MRLVRVSGVVGVYDDSPATSADTLARDFK